MNILSIVKRLRKAARRKEERAFRKVVPMKAFVDHSTFITDLGAAGVCLQTGSVDDECLTDDSREYISARLLAAYKGLDEDDILLQYAFRRADCPVHHKETYANPKVQEINDDRHEYLRTHAGFGALELYSVLLTQGHYKGKKSTEEMVTERKRVCATVAAKAETLASEINDQFGTRVLEKEEAFRFLRKLLNFDTSLTDTVRLKRDRDLAFQLVGSILSWSDTQEHLMMGNRHVRVLSLKEASLKNDCGLPTQTTPNLLKEVLAINCDMIVVQQFQRAANPDVREEVQGRKKHTSDFERHGAFSAESSDEKTDELLADESADATIKRLGQVLKQITNEGQTYGKFTYTVILHGEDNAKLDGAIAKINRVFGTYDGALFEEKRGALAAYLAILPGNTKFKVREQWLASPHFADLSLCYAPAIGKLTTEELGDGEEYLAAFETRDHSPFYWDPFVGGAFGVFGSGMRGRGKTIFGNFLVSSAQKWGGYTCILDLGGSYTETVKHYGGTIVSLRLASRSFQINPFLLPETEENHQFLFKFLQLLIEANGKELKPEQEKELFEQIGSMYYYEPADRTLSTFYLNAPSHYKHELSKWIRGGQYGWAFDNATDNVSLAQLTCFEFEGADDYPDLMEPLVLWILGRMRAKFFDPKITNIFKLINADEAWKFIQSPKTLEWLSEMLKTGRKHLIATALWTQSAEDLGPAKRLVIDNCETVLFLGNPNFDRDLYTRDFSFNSRELELAAELKPREFLLKTREYSKVLKLNIDAKMYWRTTTRPSERHIRAQAIERYGDQALSMLAAAGGKL